MKTLPIIMGMLLVAFANATSIAPPNVIVGGCIAKPGPYDLTGSPESIAELINRVGGIPVTKDAADDYAASKLVDIVEIVFFRNGKQEKVLKFGRDDDYMRNTLIENNDVFDVRRTPLPLETHVEDAGLGEPAEPVRKTIDIDGTPHELSEAARKTLEILRTEKFDTITVDMVAPQKAFETLKDRLAKCGVTVRLKHYGNPQVYALGDPLKLRNIPLDKFMWDFDQFVHWGWIIYPDGSITYFDNQCACCWPKNFGCHESQYEAGKPEVMAKEQEAATDKPTAQP